jgi:hypothetical protein
MAECKDGRKRVVVQEYMKKNGTEITSYIRSCPAPKTLACCVCGELYPSDQMRHFQVKGETKTICQGCADIVHGLV